MPDNDKTPNSTLKKTFQKLLQKRSGKASKRPQKEPVRSSSGSSSRQQHASPSSEAPLARSKPARAPPPQFASDTGATPASSRSRVNPKQVAGHLDALGWEQATTGGAGTAEYWQFTPQRDNIDLSSAASQYGNDDDAASVGLRTPVSAFERRRTGTTRGFQPSLAGSPGLSPANSAQLLPTVTQSNTEIVPYADSNQQLHPRASIQPETKISPYADSVAFQHRLAQPQTQVTSSADKAEPARLLALSQPQAETLPSARSKAPQQNPTVVARQLQKDRQLPFEQHPFRHTAPQEQQPTPFASAQQQHPKLALEQHPEQQAHLAASPVAPAPEQPSKELMPSLQVIKPGDLVAEPPSASWQRAEPKATTPKSQPRQTYFTSATSSSPKSTPGEHAQVDSGNLTQGRQRSTDLRPAGPVPVETAQAGDLSTMQSLRPFDEVVPTPRSSSLRSELASSSSPFPQPAWSPVPSPNRQISYRHPPPSSRGHLSNRQPPLSPRRPPLDRSPSTTLSHDPSATLSRVSSYPLARNPSLGSTMGSPQHPSPSPRNTSYGITPSPQSQSDLSVYRGSNPVSDTSSQTQQYSNSMQPGSSHTPSPTHLAITTPQQQPAQPRLTTSSRRSSTHSRSPGHAVHHSRSSNTSLPPDPALQQQHQQQQQSAESVARGEQGASVGVVSGSAILDSMAQGSVMPGSDTHSGSRSSGRPGSTATNWLHSHSAQQLTANVKALAAQVVTARSKQAEELAILKLYAVLSQAHFVKQQAADWEGAFLGILALGFPLLLRHTAEVVIHQDKGYSNMVRGMAAATLKSIARWMEGQLDGAGPCQALVQQVLTQLVQEASPSASRYSGAQGPTIHENVAWDSIMPTNHSIFGASETTGMGQLLDSGTLDGMLDTDATSIMHPGRPDHRQPRWGVMETPGLASGLLGSGSVLDSEAWQEMVQHRPPTGLSRAPSLLETGATYMALDTQDVAEYARSHARGLRLTFWLFKTDQEDAWYAASSLVGSMASLGEAHIDAMGGMKLVKPLFLVVRRGGKECKAAALRALQHLTTERACRAMTARQDSYLQALVRAVQQADTGMQYPATIILARLIANDPSTHYIVAQAGLIQALAKLVEQGGMPGEVREAMSDSLKHLTASSQKNRDTLIASQVLPLIIAQLQTGEEAVQYNTARTLRHLALGSQPAHKTAALPAIVPLTQALQAGRPRVQFACASALAMLVEGHGEVCPLVLRHGGLAALATMLHTAGAQGKKAAAEALQAVAAEDEDMKPRIAKSGAILPLVSMVKTGNLQQQAAAAGALQALSYCPGRLDISAGIAAEGGIPPLVAMVTTGPLPLRSAAAGALCNLALASTQNQAAIMKAGAIPALIQLLEVAQPDGRYAAAAALYNLAGQEGKVRLAIVTCKAVPPLVQMLQAESWYCRIVAAELLGRLTMEWSNRDIIQQAGAVVPLIHLLRLKHSPGMLDNVEGPVHHLAYERGEDVIVMKGYKFAKAKTAAAATLGCLALANSAVATQLVQAGVAEQLMGMLESSSAEVRAVAAACLGDLAAAHPPLQPYLTPRLSKLVRLLSSNFKQAGSAQTDVAAAGAAIGLLAAQQATARAGLLQLGGLKPLLALLHQGTLAEQSVAANVLFDMSQGSEEAARLIHAQGVTERVHALVASTDTPAAAAGGGTAALLHNTSLLDYAGFAMTAKPSVNLLILLQIPFEELTPARSSSQPHTLVPANLLLTTVHSMGPPPSLAPLSLQNNGNLSPESISADESEQGEAEEEGEEELESRVGAVQPPYPQQGRPMHPQQGQPLYPQQGQQQAPASSHGHSSRQPSWGENTPPAYRSSHSQSSASVRPS